jgi:hypothetical protein
MDKFTILTGFKNLSGLKKNKMNWIYIFKHWFSTLLVAPILSDVLNYYYTDTQFMFSLTSLFPITFIFGLIFSLPTYIFYGLTYYFLNKKNIKSIHKKTVLISITVIGIILSFYLIFNNREQNTVLAYSLTSIFFGLIYKIEKQ